MSARISTLCAIGLCALIGGCQSPMYSGTPDDMSGSAVPAYAPGTYEPPAKIGGTPEMDEQQSVRAAGDEETYEYRGGRDPVTGRAKIQM